MKYYKVIEDGYITIIGENIVGEEISEEEYNTIMNVIENKPLTKEGFDYRLKEDLTWEEYEVIYEEGEE